MVKIAVGSKNPIKYNASVDGARKALKTTEVDAQGFNVPSGVSDQPMGDDETKRGAINRAKNAFAEYAKANEGANPDYGIGLEGGVVLNSDNDLECMAWMAVYNGSTVGVAKTSTFVLPAAIRDLVVKEGLELGIADDKVFGTSNSKQSLGAVGLLTNSIIDRAAYYEQAVILAFIPFNWPDLYPVNK